MEMERWDRSDWLMSSINCVKAPKYSAKLAKPEEKQLLWRTERKP